MGAFALLAIVGMGAPDAVIVASPDALSAAETLRTALADEGRIAVGNRVLEARAPTKTAPDLSRFRELIDQARAAYDNLNADGALQNIGQVSLELAALIDDPDAAALLARAFRVKGLAHLYKDNKEPAMTAFATAWLLERDFSPGTQEWPPEARLAYADAIAKQRRSGFGVLSLDVRPRVASVWLDGKRAGTGPMTLRELTPGEHFLLSRAPGFEPVAAVVPVSGDGKLSQASLYLQPKAPDVAQGEYLGALANAVSGALDPLMVRFVAEHLKVGMIVYVDTIGDTTRARVFDDGGELQRTQVELSTATAVRDVRARLLREIVLAPPPEAAPSVLDTRAWYEKWEIWLIIGASARAAAATSAIIVTQVREPTATIGMRGR